MYNYKNAIMLLENNFSKIDYNYKINYFVEGKTDQEIYDRIKNVSLNTGDFIIYETQSPNLNYFIYNNGNKYLSYQVTYGDNYFKNIKFDHDNNKFIDMELGFIVGNVNLSSCNISDMTHLKVLCFRNDDHFFIGEYSVIDKKYFIPNLDVNTKYDIILVDESRTIEQQISSYRTPTPQSVGEINTINITNLRIEFINNAVYMIWDIYKELKTDIEYYNIYYLGINGNENILIDERIYENYYKVTDKLVIYGQYQIEGVYKGKITKSSIYTYGTELNVIVTDGTYIPPSGNNIEIII